VGTSQIDSFTVGLSGRLTAPPGSPFTAQGVGPCWVTISPDGRFLFAVNSRHRAS
jgi:hypothetical protein